jgi:hypothetical protein
MNTTVENTVTLTDTQSSALATLQSLAPAFAEAREARERSDNTRDGAHDMAVDAAIACGDWESFEPVIAELERQIRENVDGAADAWQAKPGKSEGRFIVPNTVSHIKSRIKKAFELGVPLTDDDGQPRAFNAIKADVKDTQAAIKAERESEARAENIAACGDLRAYGAELVAMAFELVKDLPEAQLAEFVTSLESAISKHAPAETDDDDAPADVDGEIAAELAKVA